MKSLKKYRIFDTNGNILSENKVADVGRGEVCNLPYAYSAKILERAYLDGLIEGRKEKWHDLRNNPDDLPTTENLHNFSKCVLCALKFDDFVFYQIMSIHYPSKTWIVVDSDKNYSNKNVIAWCELTKFEE